MRNPLVPLSVLLFLLACSGEFFDNPTGLATLLGGTKKFELRLDSSFLASSELRGDAPKGIEAKNNQS